MNRKSADDDVSDLPPIEPSRPSQSQPPAVPEASKGGDEGASKEDTPKMSNTNKKKKGGEGDRSEKLR